MSSIRAAKVQVGVSPDPANNFVLDASLADGTMTIDRTTDPVQTVFKVNADGTVELPVNGAIITYRAQLLPVATISGTFLTIGGIPSWTKRISVMFDHVLSSTTSDMIVQIGTATGIETTGYESVSMMSVAGSGGAGANATTGFIIAKNVATYNIVGQLQITLADETSRLWIASGATGTVSVSAAGASAGTKIMDNPGPITQVKITTVSGASIFSGTTANQIAILCEGGW